MRVLFEKQKLKGGIIDVNENKGDVIVLTVCTSFLINKNSIVIVYFPFQSRFFPNTGDDNIQNNDHRSTTENNNQSFT